MEGRKVRWIAITLAICFAIYLAGLASSRAENGPAGNPVITFNKDVAPILYKNCVSCHRPGEVAPMSLLTYRQARPWARAIKEKVVERTMPPWHADPQHGVFENDRRLSQKEIDTIVAWVDSGAKEGDAKDLPPAPQFVEGWNIGQPDVIFSLLEEVSVPAEGVVPYQYYTVPTNFKEDRWVQAAEIRPGNRGVVHHVIIFVQEPGRTESRPGLRGTHLVGFAPGEEPVRFSPGTGKLIKAGSNLVFQMHYTPSGVAAKDRTSVGLVFAKGPVDKTVITRPVASRDLRIPPGADNHRVESAYTFTEDVHITGFMPHMHLRGKDFLYRAVYPDGRTEILLSVPKYDFNWQTIYKPARPVAMPKGSRLECVAHFDNSAKNRFNPDPTQEVRWGDQTWEEMMIGWITYTRDDEHLASPNATSTGGSSR